MTQTAWTKHPLQLLGSLAVITLVGGLILTAALSGEGTVQAAVAGFPDWENAGYNYGAAIPTGTTIVNATSYGLVANDGLDDSTALQNGIDANKNSGSIKVLLLPAGTVNISRQIALDGNNLIIRGAGSDPVTGTKFVFKPDLNTRYDILTSDRSLPDFDAMSSGSGTMNWVWPGRAAFKVQTREVHSQYASDYSNAAANRKDMFEGSVNFHWRSGIQVKQSSSWAALKGATVIPLEAAPNGITVGSFVTVGAANSKKMYQDWGVAESTGYYENGHLRMQAFKVTAVNASGKTITIDKPLEFDLPANNTSDGSSAIAGATYYSKVTPLKMVENVGLENFYLTLELNGLPKVGGGTYTVNPTDANNNYGNIAADYAMNGILFKWAANSWVKGIRTYMTGSHPIVTEQAHSLTIRDNNLDGAWNKGKGGMGYFRGSRVWYSLYQNNITRNLRHFTFQWSASNNVAKGNNFDSDLNLHGGWERRNLFEGNTAQVPFAHYSNNCYAPAVCGSGGESTADSSTWYPIWWGAGQKAAKWSGATGPQNVFLNNTLSKQLTSGGSYTSFYSQSNRVYQFGWDRATAQGSTYEQLKINGTLLSDWAGNENVNFSASPNTGINANCTYTGSLHSGNGTLNCGVANPTPTPTIVPPTTVPPTNTPPPGGQVEVKARIDQDTASRTKYDVDITNKGSSTLTGFSARVYVDLTEVYNSGRTVSSVKCDERYDEAGSTNCTLLQFSGNIYYFNLNYGSFNLAVNDTVSYKITLRLSDWSDNWSSSNDYSRAGLTGSFSLTTRIPVYAGSTLIYGTNP